MGEHADVSADRVLSNRVGLFGVSSALRPFLVCLVMLSGPSRDAEAATVIAEWIRPIGGAWTDPTAWSTDPIFPDDAGETTFDARIPNGLAITLDADVSLESLDLGRSFYSGTGSLRISGSFRLAAAQISGLTLTTEGTTVLDGGRSVLSNVVLRNSGLFTAGASGPFSGGTLSGPGNRFENASSGTLRLEGSSPEIDFALGGGEIVNSGSIVQSAGSGWGRLAAHRFVNTGSIDVQGGTLGILGGLENSGEIRGAAGSTIALFSGSGSMATSLASGVIDTDGDLTLGSVRIAGSVRVGGLLTTSGDSEFTGSSSFDGRAIRVDNGVTIFRAQGLDLDSLTIDYGSGLFVEGDVSVSGAFDWRGSLTTNGTLLTSGTQTMGSGFGGRLENTGELRLVSSSIGGGSVLFNSGGAELRSDSVTRLVGGGAIENFGTHVHAGNPLGLMGEIRIPYANHGLIDVQSGGLTLLGVTGGGELRVARDAWVTMGDATFAPGARVSGEGTVGLTGNLEPILADWDVTGVTSVSGSVEFAGPIRQMAELRISSGSAIFAQSDLELPRVVFEIPPFGFPAPVLVANAPLRVRENIEWGTGQFGGSASILAEGGITVPFGRTSMGIDGVELRNPGRMDFGGANRIELRNGGRLVNLPTGEVVVGASNSNTIRDASLAPPGSVLNEGTWINRSTRLDLLSRFDNPGRIVNETGDLLLARGLSTGEIVVGAGSRVVFDYDYVIDPSSSVTGAGSVEIRGAQTVGAGYQISGVTSFGFGLTVVGDAQLGSSVTGNTLEILARTHVPRVGVSTLVVADGGELIADDLQTTTLELWDGTLRSLDADPLRLRSLSGRGTAVGDVVLAGSISPGRPPTIPPRRLPARLSPGGGSRGTSALGDLEIEGDLTFDIADLVIELRGLERGVSYDAVHASGFVDLGIDALLQISLLDDFVDRILPGDEFVVLRADAGIAGRFLNALVGGRVFTREETGSFLVELVTGVGDSASLVLRDYRPVPEPSAALFLALGLAVLSIRRSSQEPPSAVG